MKNFKKGLQFGAGLIIVWAIYSILASIGSLALQSIISYFMIGMMGMK